MANASPCSPLREQRTERRLMRLRGAGTREVTTDFGFAFSLSASSTDRSNVDVASRPVRSDSEDLGKSRKRSRRCSPADNTRVKVLKSKQRTDHQTDINPPQHIASNAIQRDAEKRTTSAIARRAMSVDAESSSVHQTKQALPQPESNNRTHTQATTTKRETNAEEFKYRKRSDQAYRSPSTAEQRSVKSAREDFVDAIALSTRTTRSDGRTSKADDPDVATERKLEPTKKQCIEPPRDSIVMISSQNDVISERAAKVSTGSLSSACASRITLGELDRNHSPSRTTKALKSSLTEKSRQNEIIAKATKVEHNSAIKKHTVNKLCAQPSRNVILKAKTSRSKAEALTSRKLELEDRIEKSNKIHTSIDLEADDKSNRNARRIPGTANKQDDKSATFLRSNNQWMSKYAPQREPHKHNSARYRSLPSNVDEMDLDDLLDNIAVLAKDKKFA